MNTALFYFAIINAAFVKILKQAKMGVYSF